MSNDDGLGKNKKQGAFYLLEQYQNTHTMKFALSQSHIPDKMQDRLLGRDYLGRMQTELFEMISCMVYGGQLQQRVKIIHQESNSTLPTTFDILDKKRNYREAKSTKMGIHSKLPDYQTSRYAYVLATQPQLLTSVKGKKYPRIFIDFIRHQIHRSSEHKSLEDLIQNVTQKIKCIISVDFSIILKAWDPETTPFSRNTSIGYGERNLIYSYTRFPPGAMRDLMINPQKILSRLGLDIVNYEIKMWKSAKGAKINGCEIRQIPIATISHKEPERFLKEHTEDFKKNPEKYDPYLELMVQEDLDPISPEERGAALEDEELPKGPPGEDDSDIPF